MNRILTLMALGMVMTTAALAEDQVVTAVEPNMVCMVNNASMAKEQIPVEVGGKTYYGCCAMCKERLAKDASSRVAIDPVTGKSVDKAAAVIGALPDGKVLYFENEKNLARYNKGERAEKKESSKKG